MKKFIRLCASLALVGAFFSYPISPAQAATCSPISNSLWSKMLKNPSSYAGKTYKFWLKSSALDSRNRNIIFSYGSNGAGDVVGNSFYGSDLFAVSGWPVSYSKEKVIYSACGTIKGGYKYLTNSGMSRTAPQLKISNWKKIAVADY